MSGPLRGVVVLDLTHVLAGPYAAMILGDLGATIIKVERPGAGDDARAFPPFRGDVSAYFVTVNREKRSIALDLRAPDDRAVFEGLLAETDVLLENYRPGVMDRLGYGWEALHELHPRLVYGAVSGYGRTGPDAGKAAYDMVVQARGGVMSVTGEDGREPVRVGASIGDIVAGMFLAEGVLAALYGRERAGEGQLVDVAMLDSQIAILEHAVAIAHETGVSPGPLGARHPSITPFESFHAADGLFVIAAGNDALFGKLCDALGLGGLADDPDFATNAARCRNQAVLKRRIELVTLTAPASHWLEVLGAAGVPCGPIQDMAAVLRDPQLLTRGMVASVDFGRAGGAPVRGGGQPGEAERDGGADPLSCRTGPRRRQGRDPALAQDARRPLKRKKPGANPWLSSRCAVAPLVRPSSRGRTRRGAGSSRSACSLPSSARCRHRSDRRRTRRRR